MNKWNELSPLQKLVIGFAIVAAAALLPELMLFVDIGGLEFAFGFLIATYKPLFMKLKAVIDSMRYHINMLVCAFTGCALFQRRVFAVQVGFFCAAFFFCGSLSLAMMFMFPGVVMNGLLV